MNKGAIICVDDEQLVLLSLRDELSRIVGEFYDIELVESSDEALALLAELEQDNIEVPLIICDQIMPGMSGDQLLAKIHVHYPKIRKILLTGIASFNAVVNAINFANIYRYIPKPWDETDLSLTVKEAIRSYFQEQQLIEQNQTLQQVNQVLEREIAERKQAEKLLQESEERLESMLNSLEDVVWSAAANNLELLYLNPAAEKVFGRAIAEFLDNPALWWEVIHPEDRPQVEQFLETLRAFGSLNAEYRILQPQGEVRWVRNRSHVIYGANGTTTRLDGIIHDITVSKRMEEELIHKALYDALTGLPNRTLFMERVENALKRVQRQEDYLFALLFIDLDRFKVTNDSLGHQVGDQLLVAIARCLESIVRTSDTIARLGGDEFVILLDPMKDISDAIRIAERISLELKYPLDLEEREVFITASIGIALSSIEYKNGSELLRDADIAMYRAKAAGKARYAVFDQLMYAQAIDQLQLENDLRQAIPSQEFQLNYQPIVSLNTGKVTGFEALVRWQHPTRGFISPIEFIPIAEETGMIVSIGEWVLRSVCEQIMFWQSNFLIDQPLKVSVNLSLKQLEEPDFLEKIDEILAATGLEGQCLQLEITESMLMENVEVLIKILGQLRSRGIQLSIDDFGTGYSSLSYLHRFPVNYLKVDRSFVKGICDNAESLKITELIVTLSHNLNMEVIAEGVETQEQLTLLRQLGCEYVQGYIFSPAVPASMATELLSQQSLIVA